MGRPRTLPTPPQPQPQPQPLKMYFRKRKQEQMGQDGPNKRQRKRDSNGGIDKLADDILINILSRLSTKEAVRASAVATRWSNLWPFTHGILQFDHKSTSTGGKDIKSRVNTARERKKFKSFVNSVLELHRGPRVEGLVVNFDSEGERDRVHTYYTTSHDVDRWLSFASRKEVERLQFSFSLYDGYIFPCVSSLRSLPHGLAHLRSLSLAYVDIEDEVVRYLLASSCPHLGELRIRVSDATKNLQVIDPPSLRVLEISRCFNMESLEISAPGLVSLTYGGRRKRLRLMKFSSLRELTAGGDFCASFVTEPEEHRSYSAQLEKLVLDFRLMNEGPIYLPSDLPRLCSLKRLEVQVLAEAGLSLLYFTKLIKAAPQLCEFRIEMFHSVYPMNWDHNVFVGALALMPPRVRVPSKAGKYVHRNLKVVEIGGYIGCSTDEELVKVLIKIGRTSLESVVIDTESGYYEDPDVESFINVRERYLRDTCYCIQTGAKACHCLETGAITRDEARERAGRLVSTFPRRIKSITHVT